jgi:thermostable 8-oxoguanine DNA glycosylase
MRPYEKRIKVLEGEIGKMSQQAEALKARLLQDDSRFAQEKAQHACKVRELKAQADEKIAALEAANARQREELVGALAISGYLSLLALLVQKCKY